MKHVPVLQKEVLEYLNPKPNENFIDLTIGEAGHTLAILERNRPKGKILGIDRDFNILKEAKLKTQEDGYINRVTLVCDNFANLQKITEKYNLGEINGILFDLGFSSWHLGESRRGFSFLRNEPLDMRYDIRDKGRSAKDIINLESESEIEKILKEKSQEQFSKKIAQAIIEARRLKPVETTFDLVEIIKKTVPTWYKCKKIHFATKTFQALRITVNDELNNLEKALPQALEVLKPGGRLVIISFHSLEDKIVKNFLKEQSEKKLLKILTKKIINPSREEIQINPRSRSAKLRAAEKSQKIN